MLWLSAASTAGAAGLGTLAVQSALGEPFRAEIDLLSYEDGSGAPLVRLAAPELYRMVGFRYDAAFSGAQLNLRRHANGRNYVEIVSTQHIDEPVVYLLVELERGGMRMLRGYTVLLNPYGYGPAVAEYAPVLVPAAVPAPVPAVVPKAAAARGVKAAVAAPAAPAASAADAKQLQQMEDQLSANTQTLAGMLERVAAMEQMVKQLQAVLEKPAPAPAPPLPVVQAPLPQAAQPPRRESHWTDTMLDEALLMLAGGALMLVLGLGYWMWARGPAKPA